MKKRRPDLDKRIMRNRDMAERLDSLMQTFERKPIKVEEPRRGTDSKRRAG